MVDGKSATAGRGGLVEVGELPVRRRPRQESNGALQSQNALCFEEVGGVQFAKFKRGEPKHSWNPSCFVKPSRGSRNALGPGE